MDQADSEARPIDSRLRVLIADDHAVTREKVRSILEHHPHFEVIGEADGVKAVID
jgi:DNA-binding NarL/FixJ family response regulator